MNVNYWHQLISDDDDPTSSDVHHQHEVSVKTCVCKSFVFERNGEREVALGYVVCNCMRTVLATLVNIT